MKKLDDNLNVPVRFFQRWALISFIVFLGLVIFISNWIFIKDFKVFEGNITYVPFETFAELSKCSKPNSQRDKLQLIRCIEFPENAESLLACCKNIEIQERLVNTSSFEKRQIIILDTLRNLFFLGSDRVKGNKQDVKCLFRVEVGRTTIFDTYFKIFKKGYIKE